MPPRLPFIIGILAWCLVQYSNGRASTRVRLPMPTSETIPYVAEVMGAASYEESYEEGDEGEVKRVQRKLSGSEHKEQDLDQEEQYTDYQGVIGKPGVDFPVLPSIPRTDFNCRKVKSSGYYADLDTGCQVFHICDGGRKISFLCPNGTIFRQSHLICDWWFRVDCERSVELYEESAEQLAHDQMIYKKRAEEIAKAMNAKLVATENPRTTISVNYNQRKEVSQQKQQRRRPQPRPQPQYEQVEHERQVPAETASFVSNKHRFGNQLENQYRQYLATSTNPPPSSYNNEQSDLEYNTPQYSSSQESIEPSNFEKIRQKPQKPYENYKYTFTDGNNFQSTHTASYQSTVQNVYSTSTTAGSFPTSNDAYPSSNQYSNYQSTTSRSDLLSSNSEPDYDQGSNLGNKNYNINSNRGKINYFNSNAGKIQDSDYYSLSSNSSSENDAPIGQYVEVSNSGTPSEPFQSQSNYASTTVRPVTNKISSYNDHTPRPEKYSRIKQKPIFNVKIKPTKDTKDIAYVELLRHEERLQDLEGITPEAAAYSSLSSAEEDSRTIPVSQLITTLPPSSVTESKSRNTYLPKKAVTENKESNEKSAPATSRYASINISGTSQEIRPEIVNALMESGVTPTSAKALHSLASYISSGAAEADYTNVFNDGRHPPVSDVVLNFHSGSPITTGTEGTTNTPITSSGEVLPSVLTKATKESYSYLFSDSKEQVDVKNDDPKPLLEVDISTPKPRSTTQAPPHTTTSRQDTKEDLKLKDSSELRELAQVFSRALSAYLEDPETFKEILAQVRPTEPNVEHTTPSVDDEVLDFSDAMLGRLGTTIQPGNSDYVDDNLSIGEINSLASGKTYEQDNSLEHNTFPPTAPESLQDNQYTSASPKLLFLNGKNDSQKSNYYSKLGSAEDPSYFPTVGGVSDTSRPRYGGFQNNTNQKQKPYSPYGVDVPKNITGVPISSPSPPTSPQAQKYINRFNVTAEQNIPEPYDVNGLVKSNVLNGDHASSEEIFDSYQTSPSYLQEDSYLPGDQEKILVTSGSQSLVSSNNYLQFAKKFNEQQAQDGKRQQERFYKTNQRGKRPQSVQYSSPLSASLSAQEDLSPYFGQEPPAENLAKPSGFKAQGTPLSANDERNNNYANSDPINYHIGTSNNNLATSAPLIVSSQNYDGSTNEGSVSQEIWRSSPPVSGPSTWTVSPLFDVSSAGTSVNFNYTQKPVSPSTHQSFKVYSPTTYHPPHSSESVEIVESDWVTTVQTESPLSDDTTPPFDSNGAATTLSDDDKFRNFAKAAKEMFGMLNETAAITLMNMMAKAENNMTIRRLVLLLVNEKGKDNITAQETRESLINALLTNTGESMTTLPVQAVTPSTTQTPRKKVRVSRVRVSSTPVPVRAAQSSVKSYRGTDSMTGVYGSLPSAADLNKINSAKLYIPTPSAAPLKSSKLPLDSDARAVELLKTLYSLAAKWG